MPLLKHLTRREDWSSRLYAMLESAHPSDLLEHNCAVFAARAIDVMCDTQLAGEISGLIASADASDPVRALAELLKDSTLDEWVTEREGLPVATGALWPGDVALVVNPEDEREYLGIVVGSVVVVPTDEAGTAVLPITTVRHGWQVGER